MNPILYLLTFTCGLGNFNPTTSRNPQMEEKWTEALVCCFDAFAQIRKPMGFPISTLAGGANHDSIVSFSDTLFYTIDRCPTELSAQAFEPLKKRRETQRFRDIDGFMRSNGLSIESFCKDMCTLYLVDKIKNLYLRLPSSYDQGVMGIEISPKGKRFLVYSSYDGPDYDYFCPHRAEWFGFTIEAGQGLQTIKPSFKFSTKDWSIEEVFWLNEHEVVLKTYQEKRSLANQDKLSYTFYKTSLRPGL